MGTGGLVGVVRWGEEGGGTFSNSLPKLSLISPRPASASGAPGSLGTLLGGGGEEVSGFVPEAPNAM